MIVPNDFFGESPPPRLIGTEAECNIQLRNNHSTANYMNSGAIAAAGLTIVKKCLDNGMGLYVDLDHLEIDSAEALGPRQATIATEATIDVLREIVTRSGLEHGGVFRTAGTILHGRERTSGYHESYIFPRSIADGMLMDSVVASHLTSDIWNMSGTVRDGFQMSQKVKGIGDPPITSDFGRRTTHGNKPMAMIPADYKDFDTLGAQEWARLERRYADPGFSRTGKYAGFAAVSLVLRLVEHPELVDIAKLTEFSFRNFASSAYAFNHDLEFGETVTCNNGAEITALDYQEILIDEVIELAARIQLPQDELTAIEIWQQICDEMRASDLPSGEYAGLLDLVDFAPRHRYLTTRFGPEDLTSSDARVVTANLNWDRILPDGGGLIYWDAIGSDYFSYDDVAELARTAPPTRARVRADYIKSGDVIDANWSTVQLADGRLVKLDPYVTER